MKNFRNLVMDELETALAQQAPPRVQVRKYISIILSKTIFKKFVSYNLNTIRL